MVECTQAPRVYFCLCHEKLLCICEFSVASDADGDSNDSDDTVDEDHEKSANHKCDYSGNLKIAEV